MWRLVCYVDSSCHVDLQQDYEQLYKWPFLALLGSKCLEGRQAFFGCTAMLGS